MYLLLHKCPQSVGPQHRPSLEDIRPYHDGAFCPSASACTGNVASKAARIIPRFIWVFSLFRAHHPQTEPAAVGARRGRKRASAAATKSVQIFKAPYEAMDH